MRRAIALTLLAGLAGLAPAGGPDAAGDKPASPAARSDGPTRIGLVELDLAKREVSLEAEVCLREGVLEFLMCRWNTKTHESILHTQARADHLHAALLLLGLRQGKPARWSGDDPDARFLSPAGPGLKITFSWKDAQGQQQTADATSWLKSSGKNFVPPKEWIFVGSEVLPNNQYWAEREGEVISVTNFASAVIDVPFRSSNVDAQRDLYANTERIPPKGTKVKVTIAPLPGAEKAAHARALLEIDPLGQMRIEGEPIPLDKLEAWGEKYIMRHERGEVVIRAAGRALVQDIELAYANLRLGGVREFEYQRVPASGELLPRTPGQAKRSLAEWERKFKFPEDYIEDPAEGAQSALDQIEIKLNNLEAHRNLLKEYAEHLRKDLERYKATTRPAGAGKGS